MTALLIFIRDGKLEWVLSWVNIIFYNHYELLEVNLTLGLLILKYLKYCLKFPSRFFFLYIFFYKTLFGSKLQRIQQWFSIIFIISSIISQHIKKSKGSNLDHLCTGIKFQSYIWLFERVTDLVKIWSQFCFVLFCFISVFYQWFPKFQTTLLPSQEGKNQIKII